ncbi:MAG: PEP-CTERM-box response regulator transcription factor [Nitrospirota bacterium]|nr:PEP-CTERM-box response regulator transcription factor [Nitrospirota bacterium]
MEKLLTVDDSADIRNQLKWGLAKDYEVLQASNVEEALSLFVAHKPHVVTLDLGLPPHEEGTAEGFRCLAEFLKINPAAKVIVITGNEDRENALTAVGMGAYDFFQKPITLEELKVIIRRAYQLSHIEEENRRLQSELKFGDMEGMVGQCPKMQQVFSLIRKVATTDASVLIMGESGTGKELVARAIHATSMRKDGPFIAINCGAIPENLLESELFGHEKGSFTGAHATVAGKMEYAHKGTLFLDEIGEMPMSLQVKLLRSLQEKVVQRVGGRKDIPVDARVVAATNADITKAIQEGRFREDLYYRLGVVSITLPPLRERGDDLRVLANLFLKKYGKENRKKVTGFDSSAMDLIYVHAWPGNVRELENCIRRAVIMSESSKIEAGDLGLDEAAVSQRASMMKDMSLREAREMAEKEVIVSTIAKMGGNVARAADALGVSRPTLYDLMKKLGI